MLTPVAEERPPRIACVYGEALTPFVASVVRDLGSSVVAAGGEFVPISIEQAWQRKATLPPVDTVYVVPFDSPVHLGAPASAAEAIEAIFAEVPAAVSFAVQELCWDKIATQERLLLHGVPTPAALVTDDFAQVRAFVREHRFAILKEPHSCGGAGHFVVWLDGGHVVGDCGSHVYRIEPRRRGRMELDGDRLLHPGPYYLQRLIAKHTKHSAEPGQVLRAYIADYEICFWTERYRDQHVRPSDWIVNAGRGARYRFLHGGSHEAERLALRAAEALGMRTGVVDLVRAPDGSPFVIEADVDSHHMVIDRSYKQLPEFREFFDFDRYIARALVRRLQAPAPAPEPPSPPPRPQHAPPRRDPPRHGAQRPPRRF